MSNIRIYVANLGKYNEGYLVGEWLDLPATEDEIQDLFVKIGLGQRDDQGNYSHGVVEYDEQGYAYHYEEWAIHDYEAPFEIGEYSSIERINELAERLADLSEHDYKVIEALYKEHTSDWDEAIEIVENGDFIVYHDCYNMSDVAAYYVEESGAYDLKSMGNLAHYINYEALGRDMDIEGTFIQVDYKTIVEVLN